MSNSSAQRELSPAIREYLLSDEVFDQYERIAKEHALDPDEVSDTFSEAMYRFITGMDSLQEMKEFIVVALLLSDSITQEIISSLLLHVVSKVVKDVPDISEELLVWSKQVQTAGEKMSPVMFVRFFTSSITETFTPNDQHRLETILLSYLTGERTQEQTVLFLERSHKLGGLELSEETAKEFIQLFDVQRASVVLEEEPAEPKSIVSPDTSLPNKQDSQDQKTSVTVASKKRSHVFSEEDAKEVEQMHQSQQTVVQQMVGLAPEEQVSRICAQEAFTFFDPEQKKRCVDIVNSRVREVRDVYQTRDALERLWESGGLGMTGRRLADMMELIEQVIDHNRTQQQTHVEQIRAHAVKQHQDVQDQQSELAQKEAQILSKKYVHTTGKLPKESIEPTAPSLSRTSIARSSQVQQQQQEAKIDVDKVRSVIQRATALPKHIPSTKSYVQDVKPVPRLLGPIEELQSMELQQFRRLSKDPQQAADRVKDMMELLTDQGYTKRVEGLKAFQSSPLMKLYASITKQALISGKQVNEILAQEPGNLSKQEYQTLMKLNADLRF